MFVSKVRDDGVFDGVVEFPEGTTRIPPGHSFSLPPDIPEGFYAIMAGGWRLVEGDKPLYPPLPSEKEIADRVYKDIVDQTQMRLDGFARTRNYDGILSACSYISSTVDKFRNEGQYCVLVRDATWAKLYQILQDVEAKTRPMPSSYYEIEPELPILTWPEDSVSLG